jgi:hypothetical protein
MLGIGRGDGAEVHGDAVLDHAILFEDSIERGQRAPASIMKFSEMISNQSTTGLREKMCSVVRNAEADSDAVILKRIETIAGHKSAVLNSN